MMVPPARSRTADLLITNQLFKFKLTFVGNNNLEIYLVWSHYGYSDKVLIIKKLLEIVALYLLLGETLFLKKLIIYL